MSVAVTMKGAKLMRLCDIEGFETIADLLSAAITDAVSPGICMTEGCDYTTEIEPDQREGYCEACGGNTVGLGARACRHHLRRRHMQTHVYALKSWTIKKHGDEFSIATSAQFRTHKWRGPYSSLQRATHAIARKLQWEFTRRHNRMTRP
jgi:hypothetical protein